MGAELEARSTGYRSAFGCATIPRLPRILCTSASLGPLLGETIRGASIPSVFARLALRRNSCESPLLRILSVLTTCIADGAQANTATVTFSGTYTPLGSTDGVFAGQGGAFSQSLNFDTAMSPATSFYYTRGTDPQLIPGDRYQIGSSTFPQVAGSIQSDFFNFSGVFNAKFLDQATKLSPGNYRFLFEDTWGVCEDWNGGVCNVFGYLAAYTVNLGTDTSGVFNLANLSFVPAPLSSYGLNYMGDAGNTNAVFIHQFKSNPNAHVRYELYRLVPNTFGMTGSYYINLSPSIPFQ